MIKVLACSVVTLPLYCTVLYCTVRCGDAMTVDEETIEALRQIHSQLKLDEEVASLVD